MNISENLERSAYHFPDNIAVIDGDREVTYAEFNRDACRCASALVSIGVQPGDHVALCAPNSSAWLLLYFGALRAGAVAVTFSHLLTVTELSKIISDCRPAVLFTTSDKLNDLTDFGQAPFLKKVLTGQGDFSFSPFLKTGRPDFQTINRNRQDTAAILYTGGTTGIPKGAMLSHGNLQSSAFNVAHYERSDQNDRALCFLPLNHVFGQVHITHSMVFSGGGIVLQPAFDIERALAAIQQHRITNFYAVPTIYIRLLELDDLREKMNSIRYCFSAAASMAVEVVREWKNKTGLNIHESYGMTESAAMVTYNHYYQHVVGSVGTPINLVEVQIRDLEGKELPPGSQGNLIMRIQNLKKRWSTEGGYRQVLAIAVPLILSTASWSIQHFVDRMFLTWYAPEAIAAAMPAGMVYFSVVSIFMGTAGYASTFVAQYYGAEQFHRIGPALWQGVWISMLAGVVLLCMIPFAEGIFQWVGHDEAVQRSEVAYFRIICLGGGPYIASYALSGFYSGRGKTWPVMWVNILATAVNLILDYALIFGQWGFPEMGIEGAGIATVIAGIFSFFVFLGLIAAKGHNRQYRTISGWRPEKALFNRLLKYGVPSGVQFFLEMASFTTFILLVGRLGTTSLAASNIAFNINTLAFMPMIGCGIAISMLVGQYLGADKPDLAQESVYSGFHLTFVYMTSIAAAYVLLPKIFVAPFALNADPQEFTEIYRYSIVLLRFVAVYSVFDTMNIIFTSAIKGAGDTRYVMLMSVVLSLLVLIIPTYLAIVVFKYGLMISWMLATIYIIILGITFYLRFLGGKWKTMRVIETPPQVPRTGSIKWGRNVK